MIRELSHDWNEMSPDARTFWIAVLVLGWASCTLLILNWRTPASDLLPLAVYVVTAVIASGIKLQLPGIFATLSPSYVVVIGAILNLGPAPCAIMAIASVLGQCIIHANSRLKLLK